jgi:Fe2+ or Zn2+ uptake regulation protein
LTEVLALEQFRKNGYKVTPQRQEILKAFLDNKNPLSADEVHQIVIKKYPGISLDTVYRNINILLEMEIIGKLNFLDNKCLYELNTGEHHHHLVCLKCGNAETINICPFKLLDLEKLEEDKQFTVIKHNFNLFGYCKQCS